jgi:hypothetical protein
MSTSCFVDGTDTGVDQVQAPAGTLTIDPDDAEFTAAWTSACEHDAALMASAASGSTPAVRRHNPNTVDSGRIVANVILRTEP